MALVVVAVVVPFRQRPCQGQGRQALRAPNGQSPQVGESVRQTSEELHGLNGVNYVCDHVYHNSSIHVPVTSVAVHPVVSVSGH